MMSEQPEPKWWADARRIHKSGAAYREIARELGVSDRAVRYACSEEVREQMSTYFGQYYRKPKNKKRIIKAVLKRRKNANGRLPPAS